ncbi:MAG TPA: hypothetical protein VEL69_07725 [Ktedonobacteraceae bacterium]|nr:hypothetical protein [Ktedonobacteraceae bacterium]
MNITTGGPHILLFERDQQLVALLNSELQLAGYECHTARTAVEVFDAIARYPVRLVLVNLAQAAAARREFWVALDTQRRGRGVQVLTFHCTNLAGYGPSSNDPNEQTNTAPADMEVDGMLGIMNMVNAIRSRLTISNTGPMSRLASYANTASVPGGQATLPVPSVSPVNTNPASMGPTLAGNPSTAPVRPSPPQASPSAQADFSRTPAPNHTDKIRAVIYPNQRTWSATRDTIVSDGQAMQAREQQPMQETSWSTRGSQQAGLAANPAHSPSPADPAVNRLSQAQAAPEQSHPNESSLAQLSRMLQEQRPPLQEALTQERSVEQRNRLLEETALQQRVRSEASPPISSMTLRASPIQDMPGDRASGSSGQRDQPSYTSARRYDESAHPNQAQPTASPALISIATPVSPAPAPAPMPQSGAVKAATSTPQRDERMGQKADNELESTTQTRYAIRKQANEDKRGARSAREEGHFEDNERQLEQGKTRVMEEEAPSTFRTPDNALLLDIVQSLPPMSSPPPQPQVHNGRATRSLGSVLLEGHLVPENRLEVAHNIQRMLRGVDMNYQLGEILLMFKLLTPDQLLAASLVSYGLITTTQISALGRIRQELHAIGLEYDLENLLILFRILTSEQLREVRSNWM